MHARLVENDVRKFRQAVLDVLHPAAARRCVAGCFSSGFQNVVSLIQQASFSTRSLKPKAWNISIVRQAMPSACPRSKGPGFCSTMQVLMSGKAASCAASVKPGGAAADDENVDFGRHRAGGAGGRMTLRRVGDFRIAGLKSIEVELHATLPGPSGPRFFICSVC